MTLQLFTFYSHLNTIVLHFWHDLAVFDFSHLRVLHDRELHGDRYLYSSQPSPQLSSPSSLLSCNSFDIVHPHLIPAATIPAAPSLSPSPSPSKRECKIWICNNISCWRTSKSKQCGNAEWLVQQQKPQKNSTEYSRNTQYGWHSMTNQPLYNSSIAFSHSDARSIRYLSPLSWLYCKAQSLLPRY